MTMLPFGQVAPIARRVWAYVIDALIASVIPVIGTAVAVLLVLGPLRGAEPAKTMLVLGLILSPIVALLMVAWAVVYTLMQTRGGSIGMRARGLRMVNAADGEPVGFWRALLRNLVFGATAAFVVGMFSPLFDGSGRFQGWHDKAGRTLMMDARVVPPQPEPEPEPEAPAPPLLPAPSFDRLPPAPMPGFAPAGSRGAPQLDVPVEPSRPAPAAPPAAPAVATPSTPVQPAAPIADPGSLIAFVPGVTPARPVAPSSPASQPVTPHRPQTASTHQISAPADAPAAPPASAPAASEEDDFEQTRLSVPGHRLVLTWDDGTRATVSRRTVFGRNPAAEPGAIVISVRDETLSLSKTHFEVAAEVSGGWLMDRHSTNGTVLIREGVRIECTPGERVPIRLGDVIEIGDRTVAIGGYV